MEYFELAFVPFLYLSLAVCLVFYIHAYYSKAYNVGNMQSPLIIMASLSCTTLLVNALNNTFSSKIVKSILPILFYTFIYSATRLQISFFGRISVLSTTLTKRQTEIASNFLLFCLVCVNISAILVDIDLFVSGGVDTGRAAVVLV